MIRELQFGDLELLQSYPTSFPFPNLKSGLYCSQKAIVDKDEKFVGSAMLKLTAEAILILDPKLTPISKAFLINEAFTEVPKEMNKFGLDQIHVFVLPESDVAYASMLRKHFGFERARGIPLVLTKNG